MFFFFFLFEHGYTFRKREKEAALKTIKLRAENNKIQEQQNVYQFL
jgi:hypothetical protein